MLPNEWVDLHWIHRSRVIWVLLVKLVKKAFRTTRLSPIFSPRPLYRIPRPIRFAVLHAGVTWVTALTFPPAIELPAIVIPILWAGSFALAYSIMAVFRV